MSGVGGKRERPRGRADRGREGVTMTITVARRIFVGNLSYQTSWQDLKDHFSQVGAVRYADVLREGGPGSRSKGCGIVEFETPDDAAAAIQQLHDSELGGRKIWVREDREDRELQGERDHQGGSQYGGSERSLSRGPAKRQFRDDRYGGEAVTVGRRVYVSNLAFSTSWQDLKDHMKQAGRVLHADILTDAEGNSKGSGIVEFERPQDALHAISRLSNSTLGGRQIHVREDREDPGTSMRAGRSGAGAYQERHVSAGGSSFGGRPASSAAPGTQIVVHGLPYRTSWQDLKDMCRPAGAVVHADIVKNPDGSSKGWGTVSFATPSDAQAAIQLLNGTTLEGRVVSAKLDKFV